ncbi:MAG: hypothetical protein WBL06_03800 [Pseudolysinimonas sp.]|uniref:hypothetical protein n=1 Tax=Pseudolysinimonas sp. TaxID=2680009 RepID=UPI003C77CD43
MRSRLAATAVAALVLLGSVVMASPARADGGQSVDEGYVMVLQALSFLVNDPGPDGTAQALAMVDDALSAEDQDGVDVQTLERAAISLEAGQAEEARTLLQESIAEAVAALEPAIGEESGTTVMLAPLPPRGALSVTDWFFLVLSVIVAAVGIALAVIFRPHESLRELRREITAAKGTRGDAASTQEES